MNWKTGPHHGGMWHSAVIHQHGISAMIAIERSCFNRWLVRVEGGLYSGPLSKGFIDAVRGLDLFKNRRDSGEIRFNGIGREQGFSSSERIRHQCGSSILINRDDFSTSYLEQGSPVSGVLRRNGEMKRFTRFEVSEGCYDFQTYIGNWHCIHQPGTE